MNNKKLAALSDEEIVYCIDEITREIYELRPRLKDLYFRRRNLRNMLEKKHRKNKTTI